MNPYRRTWIVRVRIDAGLTASAKEVAEVLSASGLISPIAMTDWQSVNRALHRAPRDPSVLSDVKELQAAGFLGRWQGNRFKQSRGWRLTLPEETALPIETGV